MNKALKIKLRTNTSIGKITLDARNANRFQTKENSNNILSLKIIQQLNTTLITTTRSFRKSNEFGLVQPSFGTLNIGSFTSSSPSSSSSALSWKIGFGCVFRYALEIYRGSFSAYKKKV